MVRNHVNFHADFLTTNKATCKVSGCSEKVKEVDIFLQVSRTVNHINHIIGNNASLLHLNWPRYSERYSEW